MTAQTGIGDSLSASLADAARLVAHVDAGHSLATLLGDTLGRIGPRRRAAVLDLTHGTLRQYGRVQRVLGSLAHHGTPDVRVRALLWCAMYALDTQRHANYTVVDQAVRACSGLGHAAAGGFTNAILRAYLRRRDSVCAGAGRHPESRHQHPAWWIRRVRRAYPDRWREVLAAGNREPHMALRVNRRRISPDAYGTLLEHTGLDADRVGDTGFLLARPVPIGRIPGFDAGLVSVQDLSAQAAAGYLDLADGQRVLDACAAPGGKAAHILETAAVELTALDHDPGRAARVRDNLERLGLAANVGVHDCTDIESWWNGAPFDRILADLPCTGSGVVCRHPDIKWLRREDDLDRFAKTQLRILTALWRVLAPGGKLLYATCSVFPEENDAVMTVFLERIQDGIRLALPDAAPAQRLPTARGDGFYYALLVKRG